MCGGGPDGRGPEDEGPDFIEIILITEGKWPLCPRIPYIPTGISLEPVLAGQLNSFPSK